jgi:NADH dehydrogenase [ubiquinone] 1 alpha subcomplex assembly factor 7
VPLFKNIISWIQEKGPIPLDQYIAKCLFHETEGYYTTQKVIGKTADFITAPEISQVFGEMIALWGYLAWKSMGNPSTLHLLELGPGRGTLMKDFLRTAKSWPLFYKALNIHLVEKSTFLKKQQQENLDAPILWHEDILYCPAEPTLLIANEFFDAFPLKQFKREKENWAEHCIDYDPLNQELQTIWKLAETPLPYLSSLDSDCHFYEISLEREAYFEKMLGHYQNTLFRGVVIDYGDSHFNNINTFQALQNHNKINPLKNPGSADLTAWVDFGKLQNLAHQYGFTTEGPSLQKDYLTGLGIVERTEQLAIKSQNPHNLLWGTHRLIGAREMGTLFKVLQLINPPI